MFFEHYSDHVQGKLRDIRSAMLAAGIKKLVISSGQLIYRFRDDLHYPFKANSYFLEWLPLLRPNCYLLIDLNSNKPWLFIPKQDDLWHSEPGPIPAILQNTFQVDYYLKAERLKRIVADSPDTAIIGSDKQANWSAKIQLNPEHLLSRIDYLRCWKSDWEIGCIRQANRLAVKGHHKAEQLFRRGASEYAIHMGYLSAINCVESELPYDNIIGLNEQAAILHHMQLSKDPPPQHLSLLIDAGAPFQGYSADITRTHATIPGFFADLITAVDRLQQDIVSEISPGKTYLDLHISAYRKMAYLLKDTDLIRATPEFIVARRLVSNFFPHGLGHLLGTQVHDRGGFLINPDGDVLKPPAKHPHLRFTRKLEERQVFTIEPGLYFIKSFLDILRKDENSKYINWQLIDELTPYGGIRVEDDIVIHNHGIENITRDAFSSVKAICEKDITARPVINHKEPDSKHFVLGYN